MSNSEIRGASPTTERIFGVILAGGKSRRFGRPKVFATLGGAPMASWGVRALQAAGLAVGVISGEDGVESVLGVPARPDLKAGLGPIGGLWTALQWARERGDDGVLLLGCDMPLVSEALLRTILGWSDNAPAVVPLGSEGPEPLCALYRAACRSAVEHRLHSENRSMRGLAQAIGAVFIDEDAVAGVADPKIDFLNVNTVRERNRVEHLLHARRPGDPTVSEDGSSRRLREDARACLDAAVSAVEPTRLVKEVLEQHPETLPGTDPVHVVAVGKAAAAMARAACEILGPRVVDGVVIAPTDPEMPTSGNLRAFRGGHPVPTEGSERGARAVAQLVNEFGEGDWLLCLISGGGSALMTLPPSGISLCDVRETTDMLLRAGATIDELNCVRKHLDRLKGGRLAQIAAPARVLALLLSDVLGDRPDVIASGPLSPDPTKFADALAIVDRHQLRGRIPAAALEYLESGTRGAVPESPGPEARYFDDVDVRIVGSNRVAAHAALQEAERRGYRTRLLTTTLSGEASEVGRMLAARGLEIRGARSPITPPACLIASGETTVDVRGAGRGGRNQELVLGAALALHGRGPLLLASMGTDGIDGASHAAGAFADHTTIARAEALGLDAAAALTANDSTPFFEALDDLIVTGPTGTNVMDVQIVLIPD